MLVPTTISILLFPNFINAFSSGGPSSACQTMLPGHGASAQTSAITDQYTFNLSKNQINVGDSIDITINGQHKGAFLQVRPIDGSFSLTGEFSDSNNNYDTLSCDGKAKSTMTHKTSSQKSGTTVNWLATEAGEFALYVTIVQSKNVYWVKEKIGTVTVSEVTTTTETTTTTTTASVSENDSTTSSTTTSTTISTASTTTTTSSTVSTATQYFVSLLLLKCLV